MNEVLRFLRLEGANTDVLPLWEVIVALSIALFCALVIGATYRSCHRSAGYSQSYVHSLILTSLVTAVIMIVIGSNIARAFSLVGALSVIRFRNAIKETRDVGYIFFSMAIAMAAGTRFYAVAMVATGFICLTLMILTRLDYAASPLQPERLLRVQMPVGVDPISLLDATFQKVFSSYSLALVRTAKQGLAVEAVFSVRQRPDLTAVEVLDQIRAAGENIKVTYHYDFHTEDV